MQNSQSLGPILMAVAAVQMLILMLGVLRRSYYAVALPVLAATGVVSALLFWVGYTMSNMEADLAELDAEDEEQPQPAGALH
jgi:hypothetical protein